MLIRERPVQAYIDHADAFVRQRVDRLHDGLGAGTHQHDDAFGLRITVVVEQAILPACQPGQFVHGRLHDARRIVVEAIYRFASLEIHIRILCGAANERIVRIQRALAVRVNEIVIHHGAHIVFTNEIDLADLVRGPKAIKEVNERHPRLQRRRVCNQREILCCLNRRRREQTEPGRSCSHHILVITEDRQALRGE